MLPALYIAPTRGSAAGENPNTANALQILAVDEGRGGAGGIELRWQLPTATTDTINRQTDTWQTTWPAGFKLQPAGAYLLPMYTFIVNPTEDTAMDATENATVDAFLDEAAILRESEVPGARATAATGADIAAWIGLEIQELTTQVYTGPLVPGPSMIPNALGYEQPAYAEPVAPPPMPTSPLFIVRQTRVRGQVEMVIGLSPVFQDPHSDQLLLATELTGRIAQATLPTAGIGAASEHGRGASIAQSATTQTATASGVDQALPPTNPLAGQTSWKIAVSQSGIQELKSADLAAVGLADAATQTLALYRNGQEIALHVIDINGNGRLDAAGDAIRFFAPAPGDRWNTQDIYWLAQQDNQDRQRMAVAAPRAGEFPLRTTAWAEGTWRAPTVYKSNLPGPSGDSWFHLDAIAQPAVSVEERRLQADIAPTLPLAADGNLTPTVHLEGTLYRLNGFTFQNVPHRLRFAAENGTHIERTYQFTNTGSAANVQFAGELSAPTPTLEVTLLTGEQPVAVLFDRLEWQQPVNLNFRIGGQNRGADFTGLPGDWRYRLRNLPADAVLYEVTAERTPKIHTLLPTDGDQYLIAGPDAGRYIVAGPGTLHTPQITQHTPIALATGGADAIYIAPAFLHEALAPLVEHRRAQGYQVAVVDIHQIYDGWSYGHVAPDAIRSFLRHAVAVWRPAPISVVLVGDGTRDPHDYLDHANPNLIPPYMANVDPWLGETACDSCYGQLDGSHPLSETSFAMDIWVGRFPVINAPELRNVIDKILRYENATDTHAPWRRIAVQITDDYFFPDIGNGNMELKDRAGDFVASAEEINALKPPGIHVRRHYFNRELSTSQLAELSQYPDPKSSPDNPQTLRERYTGYLPWYTHDSDEAWQRSIRLMNQGAGLVTFTGHANHWKWASTTETSQTNQLFGLWDVLKLNNRDELFIGLSMTCYTAQFTEPAPEHFTLDEHLLLHPGGGAAAVWGPTGLSVVHGHDALQTGFHERLWAAAPMTARMGELVEAGYAEIRRGTCCDDVLKTFVLLGDPLMPARAQAFDTYFAPSVSKAN